MDRAETSMADMRLPLLSRRKRLPCCATVLQHRLVLSCPIRRAASRLPGHSHRHVVPSSSLQSSVRLFMDIYLRTLLLAPRCCTTLTYRSACVQMRHSFGDRTRRAVRLQWCQEPVYALQQHLRGARDCLTTTILLPEAYLVSLCDCWLPVG